jgi:hypothetical protein
VRCISTVRPLYFKIFSASFLITFLSPEIAMSINRHYSYYYYYYYYYYTDSYKTQDRVDMQLGQK